MTTRRRRAPVRRAARTSRLVWTNVEVNKSLTSAGIQITDMLSLSGNLKHDATIERIRGNLILSGMRTANSIGSFETDIGLWIGSENSTIATVPDPADQTDEAAWLYKHTYFGFFQGDGTLASPTGQLIYNIPVDIKAKRRFRENFNTLLFVINVQNVGLTVNAVCLFKARILLRVP